MSAKYCSSYMIVLLKFKIYLMLKFDLYFANVSVNFAKNITFYKFFSN